MGIFTELSILYSKYKPEKCMYCHQLSIGVFSFLYSDGAPQTLRVSYQHPEGNIHEPFHLQHG